MDTNKKTLFVVLVVFLFCLFYARGELVAENFNSYPASSMWAWYNDSYSCNRSVTNGVLSIKSQGDSDCFYVSHFAVNKSEDWTLSARMKLTGTTTSKCGWSVQDEDSTQAVAAGHTPYTVDAIPNDGTSRCAFAASGNTCTPSCSNVRLFYYNPTWTGYVAYNPYFDSAYHTYILQYHAGATPYIDYFVDGESVATITLSGATCNYNEILRVVFGCQDEASSADGQLYLEYVYMQGTIINTTVALTGCEYSGEDCVDNCIFNDDYDYQCTLEEMNYQVTPENESYYPSGKVCVDASDSYYEMQKSLFPNNYYEGAEETFKLNITGNGSFVEHRLAYYDSTDSEHRNIYTIQWWTDDDGNHTYMQYVDDDAVVSLCTDCFSLGIEHSYKITHLNFNDLDKSFYNASSGTTQAMQKETFTLQIDGNNSKIYANLPVNENLNANHSQLLNRFSFSWFDAKVCLDDYKIIGLKSTGTAGDEYDNLPVGAWCDSNADCLTESCQYHYCAYKPGGDPCTYSWQCLSKICQNGHCRKPELADSLTAAKNQIFGNSPATGNIVSLIFVITIPLLMTFATRSLIGAAAGVIFGVAAAFMFVFIGWMSPFILIAMMFLFIIAGVLLMLLRS